MGASGGRFGLLQELQPQMVGIEFRLIPHHDTRFANEKAGSVELTLKLLSVIRLLLPEGTASSNNGTRNARSPWPGKRTVCRGKCSDAEPVSCGESVTV